MMKQTIALTYEDSRFELPFGLTAERALADMGVIDPAIIPSYQDDPIIGVLVNNDLQPLCTRLETDCTLEPVRIFSDLGKRMYRHSICYLLGCAVSGLYPDRRLVIGHSLGDGYYYSFDDQYLLSPDDISRISQVMQDLASSNLPIERVRIPYAQAMEYFRQRRFQETEALLSYRNDPAIDLYQLNGYLDVTYEPLVHTTAVLTVWELRPYGDRGMLLRYPRSFDFTKLDTWKDNPLLFSVFKEYKEWGRILGVSSLGKLNQICASGQIQSFIRMAEALQAKKIAKLADKIIGNDGIKVVFIAGPSSSGKTTFAQKLCIQLQVMGKRPIKISLDDYYLTREQIPVDGNGGKDYEALQALDTARFTQDLRDLYDGKEVDLPHFDFKHNRRYFLERPIHLDRHSILVIEGIHGLNPALVPRIDQETTFRIYISALTQLNLDDHNRVSTTDNRILRRLVRDSRTRGVSAETTLSMWPSVQRGENLHIFPYQNNADVMLNSALDYELGVLAPFAQPLLKTVKPSDTKAYPLARRLLAFIENTYPIPESAVPKDSLLREFIGGSEFDVV